MTNLHFLSLKKPFLITILLCYLCFSSKLFSMGNRSRLVIPYLKVPQISSPNSKAMSKLLSELERRTSVKVSLKVERVSVTSKKLFLYPLVVLLGEKSFPKLPTPTIAILRSYLTGGGTLFINKSSGAAGGGFDRSVRRLTKRLFPQFPLKKLGSKHTLLKSFYLVRRFGGRVFQRPYIEGVTQNDRSMVIYSMNDHNGAWERDSFGNWTYPVVPGGYTQREHAFRFGINVVMYSLCVNYKSDMVHVPFIMKRRK